MVIKKPKIKLDKFGFDLDKPNPVDKLIGIPTEIGERVPPLKEAQSLGGRVRKFQYVPTFEDIEEEQQTKELQEEIPVFPNIVVEVGQNIVNVPTLTEPTTYSPEEAVQFGVILEPNWGLKLTPAENERGFTYSLIEPTGWEILAEDSFISPEGQIFNLRQIRALELAEEAGVAKLEDYPEGAFPFKPPSTYQPPEPADFTDIITQLGARTLDLKLEDYPRVEFELQDIADYYFPKVPDIQAEFPQGGAPFEMFEEIAFAEERFEEFKTVLQEIGKTPEMEAFLKSIFPNITSVQLDEMLGDVGEQLPIAPIPDSWQGSNVAWVEKQIGRKLSLGEIMGSKPIPELGNQKWTQALSTAVATGGHLPKDIPYISIQEGAKVFAESLTKLPTQVAVAFLQATQGMNGASVVNKNWADEFIQEANEDYNAFVQRIAEEYPDSVAMETFAAASQSLAFSLLSMGAGLVAGGPIAMLPIPGSRFAAYAVGTTASGTVAFQMVSYQIMQQYLELKNEEKIERTGEGLTLEEENKLKKEFAAKATQYGLWEAVPEALSNLAFILLLAPLRKVVGNLAPQMVRRLTAVYGEELITETITQKGQAGIEAAVGLRDGNISWYEAFKEVAPQTFLLTTIMAGSSVVIVGATQKIKNSLKKEIGENHPMYPELVQNIETKLSEVIAMADVSQNTMNALTPETKAEVETEVARLEKEGLPEESARQLALDNIAETNEEISKVTNMLSEIEAVQELEIAGPKSEADAATFDQKIESMKVDVTSQEGFERVFEAQLKREGFIDDITKEEYVKDGIEKYKESLGDVKPNIKEQTTILKNEYEALTAEPQTKKGKVNTPVETRQTIGKYEVMIDEEGNIDICG